jgi:hypothetical protein
MLARSNTGSFSVTAQVSGCPNRDWSILLQFYCGWKPQPRKSNPSALSQLGIRVP